LQSSHQCCSIDDIAHRLPHEEIALAIVLFTHMNTMNPRSRFGYDEIEQQELQITHPFSILASVELLVWVVEGSGRPLHNGGRLAERAQQLPTHPRLPAQSTRAYQGGSARACRHLQALLALHACQCHARQARPSPTKSPLPPMLSSCSWGCSKCSAPMADED
jgi:hypothetical protein